MDHLVYQPQFVGPYYGTHGPEPLTVSQPDKLLFPDEAPRPDPPVVVGDYAGGVSPDFANTAGHVPILPDILADEPSMILLLA